MKSYRLPLAALIGFYLLMALSFGLNTPFALIDDYSGREDFFLLNQVGRFRPIFDINNFIWFKIFPTQFEIHHLFRIVQKLFIYFLGIKILGLVTEEKKYSLLVFTIFFLLHPIAPETRLLPQELTLMVFASLLFYSVGYFYKKKQA